MSDTTAAPVSGRDQRLLDRYATFRAGASLANAVPGYTGLGSRATSLADRIAARHPGLDVSSVQTPDYSNWQDLGPGSNEQGLAGLTRVAARQFKNQGGDFDQRMAGFRAKLGSSTAGAIQRGAQAELMPSLNAAQERADSLAGTAAISAGDEQAMKSRLSAMVRSAESTRMARIGAQLGIGSMASSPAAAALAQQSAEEADQAITSSMRDMGLQINETNRSQARMDVDLAARIASARHAVLSGNPTTLASMQTDITAMLDALYSRNQTMDMMQKQIAEAGKSSLADRLSTWTGVAKGITGLATGAYAGGQSMGAWGGTSAVGGGSGGAGSSPMPEPAGGVYGGGMFLA